MKADTLINHVHLATMTEGQESPYGAIQEGAIAITDGKISWLGDMAEMPDIACDHVINGDGQWLTPGLIDCHTHLIYGGCRAQEFEARLSGVSYETIARQGGGINSTVKATRESSAEQLFSTANRRLQRLMAEGVTTVEIKSGYGLDTANELKMLAVMQQLDSSHSITIKKTLLVAHALPPEYINDSDGYIALICDEIIPKTVKMNLADSVDVFCEGIGFTTAQCRKVFETAKQQKLEIKGHVEQLSYLSGATLVAEFDGLSVDHIEYLPEQDIKQLADKNVTAVILPAAYYFLNETQKPPIQALRNAGVAMAVATDHNPGSSPTLSLLATMNQACVLFGLTPEESLAGVTRHAAKALGLQDNKGQLAVGYDADLLLWDIDHLAELSYGINLNRPQSIWVNGKQQGNHDV